MTSSCLSAIRSNFFSFSEKEKNVAKYVLEAPEKVIHQTIQEVASDLAVSDATIFRFCRRIGFTGYKQLKITLASEISSSTKEEKLANNHIKENGNSIIENINHLIFSTLRSTFQINDTTVINQAAAILCHAERVEFYGSGSSAGIALDAHYKYAQIGIKAFSFLDSHFQLMAASQLSHNDVAVIISQTEFTRENNQILNAAKEKGAKTIGITSFIQSPLNNKVDVAFFTNTDLINSELQPLAIHFSIISILDAIFMNVKNLKERNNEVEALN